MHTIVNSEYWFGLNSQWKQIKDDVSMFAQIKRALDIDWKSIQPKSYVLLVQTNYIPY